MTTPPPFPVLIDVTAGITWPRPAAVVAPRVQVITDVAHRITAVFDEAGLSMVDRYSALQVAKALVLVSGAALVPPAAAAAPQESVGGEQ